jgi:CheY-like chemotaxis protein
MRNSTETATGTAAWATHSRGILPRQPRILLAEDDTEMRKLLVARLARAGFHVIECADGYELLDHLGYPALVSQPDDFDLIVSDIRMPGVSGMEVLEGIHETEWSVPMILITAFGNEDTHQEAARLGAASTFNKPFDIDDLIERIREVLVLDEAQGDNWNLPIQSREPAFTPLRVAFRHMAPVDFIQARIEEAATILSTLPEPILYCRVVVTGPHDSTGGRYHIQIMVTLRDRVIVVRSNQRSIKNETELYDAIPVAFDITRAKVQRHLDLERDRWSA